MIFKFRDWAFDLKVLAWVLVALALSVAHCNYASACSRCGIFGNKCRFQHRVAVQKVIAAPVVQNYHISYFVGAPIRAEAIVQKTMEQDPEYQSFLQYKRNLAAMEKPAPEAPAEVASVLSAKCASCHSGDKPAAGLLLDGTGEISPELVGKIRNSVLSGKMPKDRPPLTKEEVDNLALELGIYVEEWFKKEE